MATKRTNQLKQAEDDYGIIVRDSTSKLAPCAGYAGDGVMASLVVDVVVEFQSRPG